MVSVPQRDMIVYQAGAFESTRVLFEGETLPPEAKPIPEQDEDADEGYYFRPRPPGFDNRSNLSPVLRRYGALEFGYRKGKWVREDGERVWKPSRFEVWYRNPNTGQLRIRGDCLVVEHVTYRGGQRGEYAWQEWQHHMGIRPVFLRVRDAVRIVEQRTGFGVKVIKMDANAPILQPTTAPRLLERA